MNDFQNRWKYEIDWEYPEDQTIPPEAVRGTYKLDGNGQLGEFMKNENYRPIEVCERVLKSYMHAVAKHNPNQWISEIDPSVEHLFPEIPDNKIVGWWYVDEKGRITKKFRKSSQFEK